MLKQICYDQINVALALVGTFTYCRMLKLLLNIRKFKRLSKEEECPKMRPARPASSLSGG